MATDKYAVIVAAEPADRHARPGTVYAVWRVYQHRPDASACARVYQAVLRRPTFVAELEPALAAVRRESTWAVLDWDTRQLYPFASRQEAQGYADQRQLTLIEIPSQTAPGPAGARAPVRRGVPQFRAPTEPSPVA